MAEDIVDLDLIRPRLLPGAPAREPTAEYSRDLNPSDIAALSARPKTEPYQIKAIRATHHALAKCLASGMKQTQASLVTGYTPTRIGQLMRDPSFAALVEDYKAEAQSIFADMTERMANITFDMLAEIQERFDAEPEKFTIPQMLDIVKTFADRTGHGPNSEVNLNVRTGDIIDRPPKETYEEWTERREKELGADSRPSLEPPARAAD